MKPPRESRDAPEKDPGRGRAGGRRESRNCTKSSFPRSSRRALQVALDRRTAGRASVGFVRKVASRDPLAKLYESLSIDEFRDAPPSE
ncbi:hypothetical protein THAOC_24460, partial [Thalassiosira oceanica]